MLFSRGLKNRGAGGGLFSGGSGGGMISTLRSPHSSRLRRQNGFLMTMAELNLTASSTASYSLSASLRFQGIL